jgi:glycosyltransferase involved in cell wall biosynthesis
VSGRDVIVFAVPDYFPAVGGTSRQVSVQARALIARGYRVEVVTRRWDRAWPREEVIDGVPVHRVGRAGHGQLAAKAAACALGAWLARNRKRIRVYQPVMWTDALYGAAAARMLTRTAMIWAIRGDVALAVAARGGPVRWLQGTVRRRCIERCRQVVLTPSMAREIDAAQLDTDTRVIPVPVDLGAFRPPDPAERVDARAALGIAPGEFTIIYVGHLQTRKAVDRLVEAFSQFRVKVPRSRLVLVGGGRGAADDTDVALRAQVTASGLDGSVVFVGVVPNPAPQLWAADVFVLPSIREGMPNSILEALACGLPCVAPPSAGGDELITPETGIVPETNDPSQLREALLRLAGDDDRRRRMSAAASEHSGRYDIERVADLYEELYARMAGTRA